MATFHIVLKKECWPNPHTRAALVEDFQLLYDNRVLAVELDGALSTKS